MDPIKRVGVGLTSFCLAMKTWAARGMAVSAVAACAFVPGVAAASVLYGITFGNQLITVNPTTGAGTLVGNLSSPMAAFGLGDTGGHLYAYDQTANLLHELNPATGATLSSIDLGLRLIGEGGIDFRSDGVGFLNSTAGVSAHIYSFTVGTGTGVSVGTESTAGIDGLAFSPTDVLYALGQTPQDDLYTVNQTTGALTLVGPTGFAGSNSVGGLEFMDGTLYAAINDSLYTINTATGAATLVGPIGFVGVSGLGDLGAAVVPEPATLLLVGSGLLAFAARRRKPS